MKLYNFENYTCKVGESASENWYLFDNSKDTDYFFHLSSFPSCYVILECENKVDKKMIHKAASLCKDNTKYKHLKDVKVDYCICGNVKKGNSVGVVVYRSNNKVLHVKI